MNRYRSDLHGFVKLTEPPTQPVVTLSAEQVGELLAHIRHLETEAYAPYQCHWRDESNKNLARALQAEAALAGTTEGSQIEEH